MPSGSVTIDLAQLEKMSARDLQLRTIALLENITELQASLERRVDAMERMLSQTTAPSATSHFLLFPLMPPEIRHRVWSLAIPTRALRLYKSSKSTTPIPALRPPALASTCREARAVAKRNGGVVTLGTHSPADSKTPAKMYRTWFDHHHDVLELERWVSLEADEPRGIREVVQRARHVLAPRAEAEWFARLFQQAALLRQVDVKFDTCLASRCSWEPDVVERLFGSNTIEILDLEESSEISRVRAILKGQWRCPFFCEFDIEGWAAARRPVSGKRDESWMRKLDGTWMSEVARGWVFYRTNMEEATPCGMDVKDARIRTALAAMPEVRLVRAYLLADVHSNP